MEAGAVPERNGDGKPADTLLDCLRPLSGSQRLPVSPRMPGGTLKPGSVLVCLSRFGAITGGGGGDD